MKSIKSIFLIASFIILCVFVGTKIHHNDKITYWSLEYRSRENLNLRKFQAAYDSIATELYNENVPIAIQFEMLYKSDLFFEQCDTLVNTFVYSTQLKYSKYRFQYFEFLKQIAEIDVRNEQIIFEIKEGIYSISDEFGDVGNEWRFKMSDEQIDRFYDVSQFIPENCDNDFFSREKRTVKYDYLNSYRAFLNYYKSKQEEQKEENLENLIDYFFVVDWAKENLYDFQKEQLLPIIENHKWDSITVNHTNDIKIFEDVVFSTYKLNIPNELLRNKIESIVR
jgi:hypothetical protein